MNNGAADVERSVPAYCPLLAKAKMASPAAANCQAVGVSEEIRRAALQAVAGSQHTPDVSWFADLAGNENYPTLDSTQDARMWALEIVLAESGR